MNNEPVYGNHIGVVISNEDPEGRNRVQVFVPYVSTTLYDDWNAKQVDIEIGPGTLDKIDAKILARLKLNLPWAEAALPMFGGNGSVSYNQNNKPQIVRAPVSGSGPPTKSSVNLDANGSQQYTAAPTVQSGPNTGSTSTPPTVASNISEMNPNVLKGIYGLAMIETDLSLSAASSDQNNSYRNYIRENGVEKEVQSLDPYYININGQKKVQPGVKILEVRNSQVVKGMKEEGLTFEESKKKYGDYGVLQVNSANNEKIGISLNTGTVEEQIAKGAYAIQKQYPEAYDDMLNGRYEEAYNRLGNGWWPSLNSWYSTANYTRALNLAQNTDINVIQAQIKTADAGGSSSSSQTTVVDSGAKIVAPDPSSTQARSAFNNITTPGGVHSKPQIGTMVWVFFYGGDTMRPVYFAGVSEPQSIGRSAG